MEQEVMQWFVRLRILYDLIIVITVIAVIYWAVKKGQFSRQEEFSRLPFEVDNANFEEEE